MEAKHRSADKRQSWGRKKPATNNQERVLCIFFLQPPNTLPCYLHITPYHSLSADWHHGFSLPWWHSALAFGPPGQQILISLERLLIPAHNVLCSSPRLRLSLLLHFITDILAASSALFFFFFLFVLLPISWVFSIKLFSRNLLKWITTLP